MCIRDRDWGLLADERHAGVQRLSRDLNRLYRDLPALHELDCEAEGFQWIDCHDSAHSTLSWLRYGRDGGFVVVAIHFTPLVHNGYRLGVPQAGRYVELLNSDSTHYGGSDAGNLGELQAQAGAWMGRPAWLEVTLPPLAVVVLRAD